MMLQALRTRVLGPLAVVVGVALTGGAVTGCAVGHPGLTSGAVTGCFNALPAARAAIHDSGAHLLGVHRLFADQLPSRLRSLPMAPGAGDTTVCAVAFRGNFGDGQVTGARAGARGHYAVVLVNAKKLDVFASYVGDRLPKTLRGRTV